MTWKKSSLIWFLMLILISSTTLWLKSLNILRTIIRGKNFNRDIVRRKVRSCSLLLWELKMVINQLMHRNCPFNERKHLKIILRLRILRCFIGPIEKMFWALIVRHEKDLNFQVLIRTFPKSTPINIQGNIYMKSTKKTMKRSREGDLRQERPPLGEGETLQQWV